MTPRMKITAKAVRELKPFGNHRTIEIIRTCPSRNSIEKKNTCFPMGAMPTIATIAANQRAHEQMNLKVFINNNTSDQVYINEAACTEGRFSVFKCVRSSKNSY